MKHLFYSFIFLLIGITSFAQDTIEGTYLPVRNTRILQVWDTAASTMIIPTIGANQVWDFSNAFGSISDTFELAVKAPNATPYASYFPNATHASFLRAPFPTADSLWLYFTVDTSGMHNLGFWAAKTQYDSVIIADPTEFIVPLSYTYGDVFTDSARFIGYFTNSGFNQKLIRTSVKTMTVNGYGTLITPDGTFNNVVLGTEDIIDSDSIFFELIPGSGNYTFYTAIPNDWHRFHFMRNNTFATSYLMEINTDSAESYIKYGWYTLPVDFGAIDGTVYDSNGVDVITSGQMNLYRENSNFTKNDILAQTNINIDGTYRFDSIPYGTYRIAARPNPAIYANAFTTYYGDTTDWVNCDTIVTSGDTTGINIIVLYSIQQTNSVTLSGNISYNTLLKAVDPVPGIDIIVERNPEDEPIISGSTDMFGNFSLHALNDGNYKMWVDIPGLAMAGTYNFTVLGGVVIDNLNFEVGADQIFPTAMLSIEEMVISKNGFVTVYPNPFNENATIKVNAKDENTVSIEIFDITGKLISKIAQNKTVYGPTSYTINDIKASGIYLIKVKLGENVETLRIIKN